MSRLDDVLRDAESLEPDERLRLIAHLWESLPRNHWAAPTDAQLTELRCRFGGTNVDPVHESAWEALRRLLKSESQANPQKLYAATRRFNLATIFVAMAIYSVLLAIMSLAQTPPVVQLYLGIFVVVVGVGQALLEHYVDARRASIRVGIGFHTACSLIVWLFASRIPIVPGFIGIVLINGFLGGAVLGYIAGVLVGGTYLLADMLRGRFGQAADAEPPAPSPISDPLFSDTKHPLDRVASTTP